tara:strand:+ start:734 stop:940 length:207 start_codon:yes stop_codon:yes gene_type:complete
MLKDGSIPAWIRHDPFQPQVLRSGGGWYIGTLKDNMPHARWTQYIPTKEMAEELLKNGEWKRIARYNP